MQKANKGGTVDFDICTHRQYAKYIFVLEKGVLINFRYGLRLGLKDDKE